ncbi:hypothetical protein C8R47DRAFT_1077470 [Mycena vitilis]|nr:hypothetical protein C8R47DRAFT_1077470 [Mycena vitilis]
MKASRRGESKVASNPGQRGQKLMVPVWTNRRDRKCDLERVGLEQAWSVPAWCQRRVGSGDASREPVIRMIAAAMHRPASLRPHCPNPALPVMGSQLPPELALEIAAHNADDVPSLCEMCLVSRFTRLSAIPHLFSTVHLACPADFSWWNAMLSRTPRLKDVVQKVKFSDAEDEAWTITAEKIKYILVPPLISTMPGVHIVEWDAIGVNIPMAARCMIMFPNVKELHLKSLCFSGFINLAELLGVCGRLTHLSFDDVDIREDWETPEERQEHASFNLAVLRELADLTALEGLTATFGRSMYQHGDSLIPLLNASRPGVLKSLTFGSLAWDKAAPVKKLLQLGATSLVSLLLRRDMYGDDNDDPFRELFRGLPIFSALKTLTIGLTSHAAYALETVTAPNLTTLIFQIPILSSMNMRQITRKYEALLAAAFPWGDARSESMKTALRRQFPLVRRIGFQFGVTGNLKREVRERMARQLVERLDETKADLAEYLEVGWQSDVDPYRAVPLGSQRVVLMKLD